MNNILIILFYYLLLFSRQFYDSRDSLVAQRVKSLPAMWEAWFWSLGQDDPLERKMATHSSILAWKIPWMEEEPGGLQSIGSQRVRYDSVTSLTFIIFPTFESLNWIFPATPSFQHFLSFWARCLLQSFRKLKFFPLRELCKDWNTWTSEGAMSGEHSRWIRTSQPRKQLPPQPGSFCLIIKKSCVTPMEDSLFSVDYFQTFLVECFQFVYFEAVLVGINQSGFLEGAHNERLPSNTIIYTISLSLKTGLWCIWPDSWSLLFHITVPTFIACHNLF